MVAFKNWSHSDARYHLISWGGEWQVSWYMTSGKSANVTCCVSSVSGWIVHLLCEMIHKSWDEFDWLDSLSVVEGLEVEDVAHSIRKVEASLLTRAMFDKSHSSFWIEDTLRQDAARMAPSVGIDMWFLSCKPRELVSFFFLFKWRRPVWKDNWTDMHCDNNILLLNKCLRQPPPSPE